MFHSIEFIKKIFFSIGISVAMSYDFLCIELIEMQNKLKSDNKDERSVYNYMVRKCA